MPPALESLCEKLSEIAEAIGEGTQALLELAEAFDRNTEALNRSNELAEGDTGPAIVRMED